MSVDARRPKTAMILAAGFGKRMRPITESLPKPLIKVGGRTLIDRILDHLEVSGIENVVVNLHHLADTLESHLGERDRPRIVFSREEKILETGGGVKKALSLLGTDPFYVINGDVCWVDGLVPALDRLAQAWEENHMDALLLLQPVILAVGYDGWRGDFVMAPDGRLTRRSERQIAPFLFAGVQVLHPRLFDSAPEGPFSLNRLYDIAEEAGRLWGMRHDGEWYHVGTPAALAEAETVIHQSSKPADTR
jgi:MurNAc alpha-1-phosphate uridylyltransferase